MKPSKTGSIPLFIEIRAWVSVNTRNFAQYGFEIINLVLLLESAAVSLRVCAFPHSIQQFPH